MNVIESINSTKILNNQKYREWYKKEKLSKLYNPYAHIVFNLGLLALLAIYNFISTKNWSLNFIPIIIGMYFFGDLVVYILHKYPLHRRYKYWTYPYDVHTVMHHRYFTADTITYDEAIDFNAVFFPAVVIAGFGLLGAPLIFISVNYFFGIDIAHIITGCASAYFLLYEFLHWASHLSSEHLLMKIPFLNYMRTHHIAHHNPRLMNRFNFGIVDPLADYIFSSHYREKLPEDKLEDHYSDLKSNFKELK